MPDTRAGLTGVAKWLAIATLIASVIGALKLYTDATTEEVRQLKAQKAAALAAADSFATIAAAMTALAGVAAESAAASGRRENAAKARLAGLLSRAGVRTDTLRYHDTTTVHDTTAATPGATPVTAGEVGQACIDVIVSCDARAAAESTRANRERDHAVTERSRADTLLTALHAANDKGPIWWRWTKKLGEWWAVFRLGQQAHR